MHIQSRLWINIILMWSGHRTMIMITTIFEIFANNRKIGFTMFIGPNTPSYLIAMLVKLEKATLIATIEMLRVQKDSRTTTGIKEELWRSNDDMKATMFKLNIIVLFEHFVFLEISLSKWKNSPENMFPIRTNLRRVLLSI